MNRFAFLTCLPFCFCWTCTLCCPPFLLLGVYGSVIWLVTRDHPLACAFVCWLQTPAPDVTTPTPSPGHAGVELGGASFEYADQVTPEHAGKGHHRSISQQSIDRFSMQRSTDDDISGDETDSSGDAGGPVRFVFWVGGEVVFFPPCSRLKESQESS